jgi:hypothetical protein
MMALRSVTRRELEKKLDYPKHSRFGFKDEDRGSFLMLPSSAVRTEIDSWEIGAMSASRRK